MGAVGLEAVANKSADFFKIHELARDGFAPSCSLRQLSLKR